MEIQEDTKEYWSWSCCSCGISIAKDIWVRIIRIIIKCTMLNVGFVCGLICVGIWCKVYRDKYKVKYKLLPREDEDIEGGVDGNNSDSQLLA